MVNKRMLAVAAVVLLAVPALGAAATIAYPTATPEQLVEGHTVFTVIQVNVNTTTQAARFAAAVAVLVREQTNENANFRFPGVLWFNDQYLVNPQNPYNNVNAYRYPCGGAVMAVNQGDPDPRLLLVNNNGVSFTPANQQGTPPYDYVTGVGYGVNNSTVGVQGFGAATQVYTDATLSAMNLGFGTDYEESYLITDPNDHQWIIDKYRGYTRLSGVGGSAPIYNFPVWVVNIMGGPVFVPDDGRLDCFPYVDEALPNGVSLPGQVADPLYNSTGITNPVTYNATKEYGCFSSGTTTELPSYDMPARDEPCAGWAEPAGNSPTGTGTPGNDATGGYCYNGNVHQPGTSCQSKTLYPTRLYNALLYFHLEDLTIAGPTKDHTDATNQDTNGCQVGTEWACANDDDSREGNSHPFNPTPHSGPGTAQRCPMGYVANDPTNHGGSDPAGSQYGTCSRQHATRNIDLYFSATSRPMAPATRGTALGTYAVTDTEGSTAPFHGTGP